MRIISGIKRGKILFTPKSNDIRPTSDKARESIYNILNSRLENGFENKTIIDIFSGTGALGLEALSRGAKNASFVDIDITLTKKNIIHCGFTNVNLIKKDATKLDYSNIAYDIIFLDAPYNKGLSDKVLQLLITKKYCHTDSLIIAEVAKEETLDTTGFNILDERIYGAAKFYILSLY